jgi:hypothetical protein
MGFRFQFGVAIAVAAMFGLTTAADAKALVVAGPPAKPGVLAGQADIVVIGKVVEVEKDTVEATPYKGAPKEQKMSYKIAVLKIEESIIGGKGLTQFRVGFPEGASAGPGTPAGPPGGPVVRPLPVRMAPVALTAGQEGCFFLSRHHDGDFYIIANNGMAPPLNKKADNYAKDLEEVKKVAKMIEDPVPALKAKDLEERFRAAQILLQRYQTPRGSTTREAIPDEENKLILALLQELPWQPKDVKPRIGSDPVPPSRAQLWHMINPQEFGFRQPKTAPRKAGEPPADFNKIMDDATTAFLKDNIDKIKIKRYAVK